MARSEHEEVRNRIAPAPAACGSQEPIFDSVDAKVLSIKKTTEKQYGSWYTRYQLETDATSPNRWITNGEVIDEKDLSRTIGKGVHIGCRRVDPKDSCHVVSYQFQGNELMRKR